MFSVNNFSINRLNNQEFAGLMLNTQRLILDADRESLGLSASVFVNFNKTVQSLVDMVYNTGYVQQTAAIREADDKRGRLYKKVRMKLQIAEFAEAGSSLLDCRDVVMNEILSKYNARVPQLPYQEETAVTSGFIYDLRHKLSESNISDLGIEDDIVRLETANNEFMEAYSARVLDKANSEDVKTVKLRQELCELFQRICLVMTFNANMGSDDVDKEMAELCQTTIAQLNVLLIEAKQRLHQRLHKGGESDDEGGESTNPEGGNIEGGGNTNTEGGGNTQGGNTEGGGNTQGGTNTEGGNTQGGGNEPDDGGVINGGNVEW